MCLMCLMLINPIKKVREREIKCDAFVIITYPHNLKNLKLMVSAHFLAVCSHASTRSTAP